MFFTKMCLFFLITLSGPIYSAEKNEDQVVKNKVILLEGKVRTYAPQWEYRPQLDGIPKFTENQDPFGYYLFKETGEWGKRDSIEIEEDKGLAIRYLVATFRKSDGSTFEWSFQKAEGVYTKDTVKFPILLDFGFNGNGNRNGNEPLFLYDLIGIEMLLKGNKYDGSRVDPSEKFQTKFEVRAFASAELQRLHLFLEAFSSKDREKFRRVLRMPLRELIGLLHSVSKHGEKFELEGVLTLVEECHKKIDSLNCYEERYRSFYRNSLKIAMRQLYGKLSQSFKKEQSRKSLLALSHKLKEIFEDPPLPPDATYQKAIQLGQVDLLKVLLKIGYPSRSEETHHSFLHVAVEKNRPQCAKVLLKLTPWMANMLDRKEKPSFGQAKRATAEQRLGEKWFDPQYKEMRKVFRDFKRISQAQKKGPRGS